MIRSDKGWAYTQNIMTRGAHFSESGLYRKRFTSYSFLISWYGRVKDDSEMLEWTQIGAYIGFWWIFVNTKMEVFNSGFGETEVWTANRSWTAESTSYLPLVTSSVLTVKDNFVSLLVQGEEIFQFIIIVVLAIIIIIIYNVIRV